MVTVDKFRKYLRLPPDDTEDLEGYLLAAKAKARSAGIPDFQDNMRSIRNVWYGSTNGSAADVSFKKFFDNVGQSAVNTSVVNAFENAIQKIGAMPAPFVKYYSTIWNIEFTDDEDWNTEE